MSTVRFSHYCLEDGDEYFGDVIAELRSFRIITPQASPSSDAPLVTSPSGSSYPLSPSSINNNNNTATNFSSPMNNNNMQQQNSISAALSSAQLSFLQMTHREYKELIVVPGNNNNNKSSKVNNNYKIEYIPTVIRGRLRFGSKGLFFDPDDAAIPVLGFRTQTVLSSWDLLRHDQQQQQMWSSTPVLPLASAVSPSFISQEAATELSKSSNSEYLNQTFVLPFSGAVTGQRRFGLPHPHLVDNSSFSAPNTFLCFILPFASTTQSFNDYLNRTNMLILARHSTVETMKRTMKLLMIQKARESTFGFKLSFLEDPDCEDIIKETCCHRIQPLIRERGRAVITSTNIYFQPTFPIASAGSSSEAANLTKISLKTVTQVERRFFDCSETALEIFFEEDSNNNNKKKSSSASASSSSSSSLVITSIFLNFETVEDRELFSSALRKHSIVRPILRAASVPFVQELWHQGKITNFDYLMFLNSFAGRSKQDLSQYPVLPWIISNYSSKIFDFEDPSNYRDLSKPIGALEPKRLDMFKTRAQDLKEMGQDPFLYGTHYSNSAYVIYFLLRSAPQLMLVLQSGKWDKPQRLFDSIPEVWKSVTENPTDVKELIPEFFDSEGDFLDLKQTISNKSASQLSMSDSELDTLFDFGKKDDGDPVRFSVKLPEWANDDVSTFLKINKMALESDIVSASIHHWVDLIFGWKQKGDEAWKANNVFHPSCYEDQDLASSTSNNNQQLSPEELDQKRAHRQMFGQVPRQIFTQPHPLRRCLERKLRRRAASKAESLDEMGEEENNNNNEQENDEEAKPLSSLREALLQLSQQDLNDILTKSTTPKASPKNSSFNQNQNRQQQNGTASSSFGSKPSSSASPSFAANNNNTSSPSLHRQQQQQQLDQEEQDAQFHHEKIEDVTARAVELAEQLERQISESQNNSMAGESNQNSSANLNSISILSQTGGAQQQQQEQPVVESSADLFANFTTVPPKEMMMPSSNNGSENDNNNNKTKEESHDDNASDDNTNNNTTSSATFSTATETSPTMLQCLPLVSPGTTLPEEVMSKFGSGNIGHIAVASSSSPSSSHNSTCHIILLSQDGTEIGVLPVTSRGFEALQVSSLPEKCISAVVWQSEESNSSASATVGTSWIILVSHRGNILVFSPYNCKVYARIPDSGDDRSDVISSVSFWKTGSLLFCGRDNGSMVCWSVTENRSSTEKDNNDNDGKEENSSSENNNDNNNDSFTSVGNPPMISKTSLHIEFETGRPIVSSCRDANITSTHHQLVFASDDGETLFTKHDATRPFVASMAPKNLVKTFAGMPHEIDMKTVAAVWPVDGKRAVKVCKMEEISETFSEEEVLEEDCVVVLGVLTNDGRIHFIGSRDDSDESDMFEILNVVELVNGTATNSSPNLNATTTASSSSSSKVVIDQCLLPVDPITTQSKNKNSCRNFIAALVNGGRSVSLLDSDSAKPVLGNLLSNNHDLSCVYSMLTASWPFVVAVDAQNGQIAVWEMLMF